MNPSQSLVRLSLEPMTTATPPKAHLPNIQHSQHKTLACHIPVVFFISQESHPKSTSASHVISSVVSANKKDTEEVFNETDFYVLATEVTFTVTWLQILMYNAAGGKAFPQLCFHALFRQPCWNPVIYHLCLVPLISSLSFFTRLNYLSFTFSKLKQKPRWCRNGVLLTNCTIFT